MANVGLIAVKASTYDEMGAGMGNGTSDERSDGMSDHMRKGTLPPKRTASWRSLVTIALAIPILVVLSLFFYFRPTEKTATPQVAVVATGEYPPFSGEKLPEQGIASAIVGLAMKEVGYDTQIRFMPWPLVERSTQESGTNKGVRAAFPYAKTPEREKDFYFSDPIVDVETSVFYNPAKTPKITPETSIQDLGNYRRLPIAGYRYLPVVEKLPKLEQAAEDNIAAFKQLLNDPQVQLVVEATAVGNQVLANSFPRQRDQIQSLPAYTSELYLMATKRNPYNRELIIQFNKALATISPDQRQEITDKVLTQLDEQNRVFLRAFDSSGYLQGYFAVGERLDSNSNSPDKSVRLPQGTQAIVEAWPATYLNAVAASDSINRASDSASDSSSDNAKESVDWVKVRILNGPLREEILYIDARAIELP